MDEQSRNPSERAYHSVWQLRVDVWSSIADLTKQLADPTMQPTTGPRPPGSWGSCSGWSH